MYNKDSNNLGEKEDDLAGIRYSYERMLDIWKVHNDNYFKRSELFMAILHSALFYALMSYWKDVKSTQFFGELFILCGIAIIGVIVASHWRSLHEKQLQYLEFCRKNLRNLEKKLVNAGVPMEYFILEAHVFSPKPENIYHNYVSGFSVTRKEAMDKYWVAEFKAIKEKFPEEEMVLDEFIIAKDIMKVGRVRGGMGRLEGHTATIILFIWLFFSGVFLSKYSSLIAS